MSSSPPIEVASVARKRPKMEFQVIGLLDLPNEIIRKIFTYLSRFDLHGSAAVVCRRFLAISRQEIFVNEMSFDLLSSRRNINPRSPEQEIPTTGEIIDTLDQEHFQNIENFLKLYPSSKLNLNYVEPYDHFVNTNHRRMFQLEELRPIAASVKKLVLAPVSYGSLDFLDENVIEFPNLEILELDLFDAEGSTVPSFPSIQHVPREYWKNFPNLRCLNIDSEYEGEKHWVRLYTRGFLCTKYEFEGLYFNFQSIGKFMDDICSNCPLLEEFTFEVHSQPMEYPQVPKSLKDEEKFFHLTRLDLSFWHGGYAKYDSDGDEAYDEESGEYLKDNEKFERDAQTFQRFKKYLEEKCPKLKNNINLKHDYEDLTYESQEITDLKAKREAELKRQFDSSPGIPLAEAVLKGLVQSRYKPAKKEN